ncbi:MAG: endonuclease/exonuclease/phosphatase family protein [Gammaproteobacteria bacterium]|nr:endonuclease/exonuclease/phosphatase family protein [Gammaproteobacteria bacterium]
MKTIFPLLLLTLIMFARLGIAAEQGAVSSSAASSVNVLSFNIRYNNPDDGEHAWPNRKGMVASVVRFHAADLIGMQEVLRSQIDDLTVLLPNYSWYGVGRNDGKNSGEFSPIFYRRDRFQLLDSGEFWLSKNPDQIGSKSWDAALPRIATWVKFRDRESKQEFIHLNTHFDHRGEVARARSAELILDRLKTLSGNMPVVVTGDFNVPPESEAYATMTSMLVDSKLESVSEPHGPEGTFGGFTVKVGDTGDRIDYVFVAEGTKVLRYAALSDQWDGRYPSDHLPVLAEIIWPAP